MTSISCIVSLYALGDGLGYFFSRKIYGYLSVKQALGLATLISIIACVILTFIGDLVSTKTIQDKQQITEDETAEDNTMTILGLLCIARLLQGLSHGTIALT